MEIVLNGSRREVAAASLAELIAEMGWGEARIAVERNLELVPRRQWSNTALAAGDRIEVVHMVGGG